jgi:hypothetical protein
VNGHKSSRDLDQVHRNLKHHGQLLLSVNPRDDLSGVVTLDLGDKDPGVLMSMSSAFCVAFSSEFEINRNYLLSPFRIF